MAEAQHGGLIGRARRRWPRLARFALFCVVGASAMLVDYAVFVPLVHPGILDPRLAAVAAYLVSSLWSWHLNRRITFEDRPVRSVTGSLGAFVLVGAGGAAVRVAVMHALMVWAAWTGPPLVYLASLVGIVAGTAVNYLGALSWAFPETDKGRLG